VQHCALLCLCIHFQAVKNSHRGANSVLNRVPHAFTFEQTAFGWRLYFLSVPVGHRENTIFYIDFFAQEDANAEKSSVATWCSLLDSFRPTTTSGLAQMSREEQLLRERKRQRSIGITSYDYQHFTDGGHFAFSAANSVYVCTNSHAQTVSVSVCCLASDYVVAQKNSQIICIISYFFLFACHFWTELFYRSYRAYSL